VFLVDGARARNLTAAHPAIGPDLMGLMADPALLDRIRAEGIGRDMLVLADICPALADRWRARSEPHPA
jgi:hypothetical protein